MAKRPKESKKPRPARTTSLKHAKPAKPRAAKALPKKAGKKKPGKVRTEISRMSWDRAYHMALRIRELDDQEKRASKEKRDTEEKLNLTELAHSDRKTLALQDWNLKKEISQCRTGRKKAITSLLDIMDAANEGGIYEGSLDKNQPPLDGGRKAGEARAPLFGGSAAGSPNGSANGAASSPAPEAPGRGTSASSSKTEPASSPADGSSVAFTDAWPRTYEFYNADGVRLLDPIVYTSARSLRDEAEKLITTHKINSRYESGLDIYGYAWMSSSNTPLLRAVRVVSPAETATAKKRKKTETAPEPELAGV